MLLILITFFKIMDIKSGEKKRKENRNNLNEIYVTIIFILTFKLYLNVCNTWLGIKLFK